MSGTLAEAIAAAPPSSATENEPTKASTWLAMDWTVVEFWASSMLSSPESSVSLRPQTPPMLFW